jgi:hypothetical protein
MHVKFFQWLSLGFGDGQPKGLDGVLGAQTGGGGNERARPAFKHGAAELEKVMAEAPTTDPDWSKAEWKKFYGQRRDAFRGALNTARKEFHDNAIPGDFTKFWEFFLPEEFLKSPLTYITAAKSGG